MMLYVFHVDVGCMMNFDMSVALSSVENLKGTIERLHGIPAVNIVLLASGGEMLTQTTQVSHYSAGTDTNPIYMFLTGDTDLPPLVAQKDNDMDLREQVKRSLELPAVYETVVTRAQLALRMCEMARDEDRSCERLVHEQHLQQQGWSAVVANMEDLTEEFRQRFRNFCSAFDSHLEKRTKYLELLRNFGDDLTQLARIPILPGLMPMAEEDFHGFDEFLGTDEVFSRSHDQQESVLMAAGNPIVQNNEKDTAGKLATDSDNISIGGDDKTSPNKKLKMGNEQLEERASSSQTSTTTTNSSIRRHNLNLLQWITSKENHNALKLMSDECVQGLSIFNEEIYEKLKIEVQKVINLAEQGDIKEIKGLGERLYQLELFKNKMKKIVQDQKELSTAFQQNQNRAINLRDASILPDLCASHQSQLLVMLENHKKISEYSRCIAKAKDELGTILHTRLKNIVWIENTMSEFDNRSLFYHRCLRRAERHIKIIEQIHQAPCIYVAAVTEVVRRKIFSGEFRQWASKLSEDFDSIHSEEIKRRELFNASFEGHFLNILFPGMNDMPPAFANENPLIFDARLPNLTKSDIEMLTSYLPDLAPEIKLPDMGPVINFFVSRSGDHQKERMNQLLKQQQAVATASQTQIDSVEIKLVEPQSDDCLKSVTDDTEFSIEQAAFQSVGTSMSVKEFQDTCQETDQVVTQSTGTLTDTNESTISTEISRLRGVLSTMSKLSMDCIKVARINLNAIRSDAKTYQEDLQSELHTLSDQWNVMRMQIDNETIENKQKNESIVAVLELKLKAYENKIEDLNKQTDAVDALKIQCATMEAELQELRDKLTLAQMEKETALATMREELIQEHKNEIESLRCRFKLMTSMDRSPSDMSLEKIERPLSSSGAATNISVSSDEQPIFDTAQHESLLAQLRAEAEAEKERAVSAAIEAERLLWQSKILPMNSESVMANCILKDMLEEKERQLDQFREKDLMITKENFQLKTRLDALTNEEGNSWLKEKIDYLNRDKTRLEEELNVEKSRRLEMENSFVKGISSSEQGALTRSKSSGSSHKYITLESCSKGDVVFVVWSMRHCQFMVVQDSLSLFFVHAESLQALNLRLPTQGEEHSGIDDMTIPIPYYAVGRVTEKEYCQARKDENRYRVTRGSKFYRIKLAPLATKQSSRRERLESFSSSLSRSVTQCESQSDAAAGIADNQRQIMPMGSTINTVVKDDVDGAAAVITSAINAPITTIMEFKEHTISITDVTEEDDEPIVSLLSEHCRYGSVSEEEEPNAAASCAAIRQSQNSVITEQPTSSSKLKLDLLLASADITTPIITTTATTTETIVCDVDNTSCGSTIRIPTISTSTSNNQTTQIVEPTTTTASSDKSTVILIPTQSTESTCSPSIPASVGTTSEDSDEFRSLEGKDETDFPISE